MSNIKQAVLEQMASAFEMMPAEIPRDATPGSMEKWDSLRHMRLIIAMEERFGIVFADHELTGLVSVDKIVDIVTNKTTK